MRNRQIIHFTSFFQGDHLAPAGMPTHPNLKVYQLAPFDVIPLFYSDETLRSRILNYSNM